MIRDKKNLELLPACPDCKKIPALEHIYYNETWKKGIWEGYTVECDCRQIVKGSIRAALKEWFRFVGRNEMDVSAKNKMNIANIKEIGKELNIPPADLRQLLDMNKEAYELLEKATALGRVMQNLLLEYMTPQELKEKLNEKILKINI